MIFRLDKAKKRYYSHMATAAGRNITFNLTFQEWLDWWALHGVDKSVAQEKNANTLCMCRYNDSGAYELGNIYCDTVSNNIKTSFKIRQANNTFRNHTECRVVTPIGKFNSIKNAAQAHNVTRDTMVYWLKTKNKEYYRDI